MGAFATNAELLLASGRDAMSNLYDIYIIPPDGLGVEAALSTTSAMVIRAMDFQPPELSAEVYQNHYKADFSRNKSFIFLDHVSPALDSLNDRAVGTGTPDPLFFQGLNQGSFVIAGRGLGKVLFWSQF